MQEVAFYDNTLINVSSMNLSFGNHSVSNSPSKAPTPLPFRHLPSGRGGEGVGGSMIVSRNYNFAIIIPLSHFVTAPLS